MIVGLGIFVGSYAFTAAVAALLLEKDHETGVTCTNCRYADRMFVPIAGPWWFYSHANGGGGKALTATMGVLQGAGLVVSIWGIVKFASWSGGTERAALARDRIAFSVAPLGDGGYAALHMRW
jgi:hypothetical protein